jgi:hypothetical protein
LAQLRDDVKNNLTGEKGNRKSRVKKRRDLEEYCFGMCDRARMCQVKEKEKKKEML